MRFIEKGPFIPQPLLEAASQGKVVFFCGAGMIFINIDILVEYAFLHLKR